MAVSDRAVVTVNALKRFFSSVVPSTSDLWIPAEALLRDEVADIQREAIADRRLGE